METFVHCIPRLWWVETELKERRAEKSKSEQRNERDRARRRAEDEM